MIIYAVLCRIYFVDKIKLSKFIPKKKCLRVFSTYLGFVLIKTHPRVKAFTLYGLTRV